MGKNVETGDIGRKQQASLNVTGTRTLPRVTAETLENDKAMGENVEMGYVGCKRASVAYLDADTYVAPCYSGNA
jgi:hypothetical protein